MSGVYSDAEHMAYVVDVRNATRDIHKIRHEEFRPALRSEQGAIHGISDLLLYVIRNYDGPGHSQLKAHIRARLNTIVDKITILLEHACVAASHIRPDPSDYSTDTHMGGNTSVNAYIGGIVNNPTRYNASSVDNILQEPHLSRIRGQRSSVIQMLNFLNTLRWRYQGPFHAEFKLHFAQAFITELGELIRSLGNALDALN